MMTIEREIFDWDDQIFTSSFGCSLGALWTSICDWKDKKNLEMDERELFLLALEQLIAKRKLIIDERFTCNEEHDDLWGNPQTEMLEWFRRNLPLRNPVKGREYEPDFWIGGGSKPDGNYPQICAWCLDDGRVVYTD